jgi:hypothetical protein
MTNQPDLKTIRAEKAKLLAAAARHEELAAKARAEAAEFETAERVWMKLFGSDNLDDLLSDGDQTMATISQMSDAELRSIGAGANLIEVRRKPPGIPPVPEMILEALRIAEAEGKPGLNPQGMVLYVRDKYWKEAGNPDIGSTAWRMWKDGRLAKPDENSSIYVIARQNEDAA